MGCGEVMAQSYGGEEAYVYKVWYMSYGYKVWHGAWGWWVIVEKSTKPHGSVQAKTLVQITRQSARSIGSGADERHQKNGAGKGDAVLEDVEVHLAHAPVLRPGVPGVEHATGAARRVGAEEHAPQHVAGGVAGRHVRLEAVLGGGGGLLEELERVGGGGAGGPAGGLECFEGAGVAALALELEAITGWTDQTWTCFGCRV